MNQEQLISITDLRQNTSQVFKSLVKWPRFILVNNKMEAVILSPHEYQRMKDFITATEMEQDADDAMYSKGFTRGVDLLNDLKTSR